MLPFPLAMAAPATATPIPVPLLVPFALLLLLIAAMPLTPPRLKHLWERYYPHVAVGLGAIVVAFYLWRVEAGGTVIRHTAHEYFSFICLIGALFVVAGGIHIKVKGEATPTVNLVFLALGAGLANIIGTTGASMVLIRPWIRLNKIRLSAFHIVFFIFIVSNVGGALTPIGDPPLFLGYLRGVPFFWLADHVLPQWFTTVSLLLMAFYVFDRRSFRRMPARLQHQSEGPDTWRFDGMKNVLFLLIIIGAVFLPDRFLLRELAMLGAAVASHRTTPKNVHLENHFTFGPIKEVAFLFIGIFATMMPALNYLEQHGKEMSAMPPTAYYFASGGLSAVLDNAPTYLNFLKLAEVSVATDAGSGGGRPAAPAVKHAAVHLLLAEKPELVIAVSLGAVFFGAMTYIGNGPNFMVKSIAEAAGVRVPTFFGYIGKYSLPILLPILGVCGWLFLR